MMIERRRITLNNNPSQKYYGDGSLNYVLRGYDGKLLKDWEPFPMKAPGWMGSGDVQFGLFGDDMAIIPGPHLLNKRWYTERLTTFTQDVWWVGNGFDDTFRSQDFVLTNISQRAAVQVYSWCGGYCTDFGISELRFTVNGTDYTIQQMIDNDFIEPIVLYSCEGFGGVSPAFTQFSQCVMNGDATPSSTWKYPEFSIYFIKKEDVIISNMRCNLKYHAFMSPPSNCDYTNIIIADINNLDLHLG